MGGTLAVGLLIALVMFISGGGSRTPTEPSEVKAATVSNSAELQNKVDALTIDNVSPTSYNTLRTEIQSSFEAGTVVESMRKSLITELEQKYINLTLQKINKFFAADPVNETAMQPLIAHLQTLGKGQQEIKDIRTKINEINYYTKVLPTEVNKFTSGSFVNFSDGKYKALKGELENLPAKYPSLKNRKSVQSVKSSSLSKLTSYYQNYVSYNMSMQNVNISIDGN